MDVVLKSPLAKCNMKFYVPSILWQDIKYPKTRRDQLQKPLWSYMPSWTPTRQFFLLHNVQQKSAPKVFGVNPPAPTPRKCPNPSRKKCLGQFGFGLDPSPPFGQCPNMSSFFLVYLPLPRGGSVAVAVCISDM